MRLARARAVFPDENAATMARMPTFSITIAIRSSSMPKPPSSRTRVCTIELSAAPFSGSTPLPIALPRDCCGCLLVLGDQRPGPGALGRAARTRFLGRAGAAPGARPVGEPARRAPLRRRGGCAQLLQGGQAED